MPLAAWTPDRVSGLGPKAGLPPLPRHGHELTILEFCETQAWSGGKSVLPSGQRGEPQRACWGWGCRTGSPAPTQPGPGGEGGLFQNFPRRPGLALALPPLCISVGALGVLLAPGPWPGGWATSAPGGLGPTRPWIQLGCQGAQAHDPGERAVPGGMRPFLAGDPLLPPQARALARTWMGPQMVPGCGVQPAS